MSARLGARDRQAAVAQRTDLGELALGEDDEQAGLAAGTVTDDHQLAADLGGHGCFCEEGTNNKGAQQQAFGLGCEEGMQQSAFHERSNAGCAFVSCGLGRASVCRRTGEPLVVLKRSAGVTHAGHGTVRERPGRKGTLVQTSTGESGGKNTHTKAGRERSNAARAKAGG